MEKNSAWKKRAGEIGDVFAVAEDYKAFISQCKTERECVAWAVAEAKAAGFRDLAEVTEKGEALKAGDKVYAAHHGKTVMLYVIGTDDIEKGMNLIGAHIDSPRLDLKPNPLYEDTDLAMIETHYYGGIKKYQWVALPLALHGVICTKDGRTVTLALGEDPKDPVFGVSDLLIHLAQKQMEKSASLVVEGEDLNAMVGSIPLADEEKEAVKKAILAKLKEEYGVEEADLVSAELTFLPAGPARDYGFDRSMVMAYGQDDKVCAYPALRAILHMDTPKRTCVTVLSDKEEVGSIGATGMQSRFFENTVTDVLRALGKDTAAAAGALSRSRMLSADVTVAFDPNYPEVMEKKNCGYAGMGLGFNKYVGARGKSGSNDARAEYVALIRRILDEADVSYAVNELGRVDLGGGGTISHFTAEYGMDVIDCGVPVFNMHAPWEITSKVDIYETLKGYEAFFAYGE